MRLRIEDFDRGAFAGGAGRVFEVANEQLSFWSPKVDRTSEIARGPMSPFFASTVEPMSTSFVSFFKIEVASFGAMRSRVRRATKLSTLRLERWCFPRTPT